MQTNPQSGVRPLTAIRDLIAVLAVLITVKEILLMHETLWTYAGPISLILALIVGVALLRSNGTSLRDIGLRWGDKKWKFVLYTVIAIIVSIVASTLISSISASLVDVNNYTAENEKYAARFDHITGNLPAFILWLSIGWIIGGFTEEILFRGVLINRIEAMIPFKYVGVTIAVIAQAVIFGQQHMYYQGWLGFAATGILGLLMGIMYLMFGRRLWPLIIAHGMTNTLGMTMLYLGTMPAG